MNKNNNNNKVELKLFPISIPQKKSTKALIDILGFQDFKISKRTYFALKFSKKWCLKRF